MRGKYLRRIGSPIKSGGHGYDFFPERHKRIRAGIKLMKQTKSISASDGALCSALLDAVEALLPNHMLACVSQPNPQTVPWTFDSDADGNPLVTVESCRCCGRDKEIRKLLSAHRKSRKGFSEPNVLEHPPT